jgi:hypothetical protein
MNLSRVVRIAELGELNVSCPIEASGEISCCQIAIDGKFADFGGDVVNNGNPQRNDRGTMGLRIVGADAFYKIRAR